MVELLATFITEMRGSIPNVPSAPDVDIEGLKSDDPDPMFVTLPLVAVGAKSANGFTWDEAGVDRVVSQINSKKSEGILGHVSIEERGSRYDLPKARWIGAVKVKGVAWAKAYIPRYAQDMREYIKVAKRTNARVGTSVYGERGQRGLADMSLETVDFGHPDRLGWAGAGAVPHLTSEMKQTSDNQGEPRMENELLIAEFKTQRDSLKTERDSALEKLSAANNLVAELRPIKDTMTTVSEMLKKEVSGAGSDIVASLNALIAELHSTRKQNTRLLAKEVISEMVELEALRPIISEMLGEVSGEQAIKDRVKALLETATVKAIAGTMVSEQAGPTAVNGGKGQKPGSKPAWAEELKKNAKAIASSIGATEGGA